MICPVRPHAPMPCHAMLCGHPDAQMHTRASAGQIATPPARRADGRRSAFLAPAPSTAADSPVWLGRIARHNSQADLRGPVPLRAGAHDPHEREGHSLSAGENRQTHLRDPVNLDRQRHTGQRGVATYTPLPGRPPFLAPQRPQFTCTVRLFGRPPRKSKPPFRAVMPWRRRCVPSLSP